MVSTKFHFWYHPEGIAIVVSFSKLLGWTDWTVKFDSAEDQHAFVANKPDGSTRRFQQSEQGLFYFVVGNAKGL